MAPPRPVPGSIPVPQYGIVLDAGSSHTSVFIYKWPADKENDTGIVSQLSYCDVSGEHPTPRHARHHRPLLGALGPAGRWVGGPHPGRTVGSTKPSLVAGRGEAGVVVREAGTAPLHAD